MSKRPVEPLPLPPNKRPRMPGRKRVKKLAKLAIVGSRHMDDYVLFSRHVCAWIAEHGKPAKIVSGGAPGADTFAQRFALANKIPFEEFAADWSLPHRSGGPIRNTLIVNACTHVLAFVAPDSVGTLNTLKKAKRRGRHTTRVYI